MKPNTRIKEILLMTTSSFSKKQLCESNILAQKYLSPTEQLEAACWNGLLDEMLPEVMHGSTLEDKLFIWKIDTGKSYIKVSMGVYPPVMDNCLTLDPHIFLCSYHMN